MSISTSESDKTNNYLNNENDSEDYRSRFDYLNQDIEENNYPLIETKVKI